MRPTRWIRRWVCVVAIAGAIGCGRGRHGDLGDAGAEGSPAADAAATCGMMTCGLHERCTSESGAPACACDTDYHREGTECVADACGLCEVESGSSCVPITEGWALQAVDGFVGPGVAGGIAAAADGGGRPVIAYGGYSVGGLRIARQRGNAWEVEEVDTRSGAAGDGVLIALAEDDTVHLVYTDFIERDWELKYAFRAADGWHVELLLRGLGDHPLAFKVDGDGHPHVAYWCEPDAPRLCHGSRSPAAGWQTEAVAPPDEITWGAAAAFDDRFALATISSRHGITYGQQTGMGWNIERIREPLGLSDTVYGAWLSIDGTGNPYVLTSIAAATSQLRFATRSGDGWADELLEELEASIPMVGAAPVIDAIGQAHVAYVEREPNRLRYARRGALGWQVEEIYEARLPLTAAVVVGEAMGPIVAFIQTGTGEGGDNQLEIAARCGE